MANDTLKVFGTTYTGVAGFKASDGNNGTKTYVRPEGTIYCDDDGSWDVTAYETIVVPAGTQGTPSASKGAVSNHSVSVTPSVTNNEGWITGGTHTGTAVTVTARELVSGTTLYCDDAASWDCANAETFVVPAGSEGTPTATKGAVSNHSVSVTPSVTNGEGWISGGTRTGSAVTVSAPELVSGSQTITQNGTVDVTTLEQVVVSVAGGTPTLQDKTVTPTTSAQTITADAGYDGLGTVTVQRMPIGVAGTPTATKGTVSNHSISITPKVTNQAGHIGSSTLTGTAVTVTASELVSGNLPITANGTDIDVSTFATVSVAVPVGPSSITAGDTPVMMDTSTTRVANTAYTTTNCSITIPKAGTYKFYWVGMRSSTSGTSGTRLYKNGSAQGTAQETWSNNIQVCNLSLSCAKNDVITVYARSRGTSYYAYCPMLVACIDWDNGFTS